MMSDPRSIKGNTRAWILFGGPILQVVSHAHLSILCIVHLERWSPKSP